MADLTDRFGTMVFSEEVMKDYLPKDIWKRLAATLEDGEPLDLDVANAVAHAMKVWAISKGATHYAHWFQPLSGITSESGDAQDIVLNEGGAGRIPSGVATGLEGGAQAAVGGSWRRQARPG